MDNLTPMEKIMSAKIAIEKLQTAYELIESACEDMLDEMIHAQDNKNRSRKMLAEDSAECIQQISENRI